MMKKLNTIPVLRKAILVGVGVSVFFFLQAGLSLGVAAEIESWFPLKINAYYGTYDAKTKKPGKPAGSLASPKKEGWYPPKKANKPYVIGVSFPHLKDPFWLSVMYGIVAEARRLGVGVKIVTAGGYTELAKQINQIENLVQQGIDGLIVSPISYTGLNSTLHEAALEGIALVSCINDNDEPLMGAKAMAYYYESGYVAGKFIGEDAKGMDEVKVVYLAGPGGAAWSTDMWTGFQDAVKKLPRKVNILACKWGDTGKSVQLQLIESALQTFPHIDYMVCNAPAADAAVGALAEAGRAKEIKIVSTYITQPQFDKVKNGSIAAAPMEFPMQSGITAVGMMVRILNGEKPGKDFPFLAIPEIVTLTKENLSQYDYEYLFGPRDFKPVFEVKPRK